MNVGNAIQTRCFIEYLSAPHHVELCRPIHVQLRSHVGDILYQMRSAQLGQTLHRRLRHHLNLHRTHRIALFAHRRQR